MVDQSTGCTPALRWHRFIRRVFASSLLMGIGTASAPPAVARTPITMVLPSMATISLLSGRTISGVRLTALGPTEVSYEKGGRRSLPVREVESISFSGPLSLEGRGLPVLSFMTDNMIPAEILFSLGRIFGPKPETSTRSVRCRQSRQIPITSSALSVQPNGEALALDPASLESSVVTDLQQARSINILMVETLRLGADSKVQLEYKICSQI
jgi:hypothetical protein